MSLYEFFKTIHILAAIAWVGGVILGQVQGARAAASQDPQRLLAYAEEQNWLGKRFYAPASGIVLLAGIAMVIESGWQFTDPWIIVGLVLFAVTVVLGMFFVGPRGEKIVATLKEAGPEAPGLQQQVKQITLLSQVDFAILILVVINMVVKPGS